MAVRGAGKHLDPGGWVDSHAHLQEDYLSEDSLVATLARASSAGVRRVVCIGTGPQTSVRALSLASRSAEGGLPPDAPDLWATIGLHPHDASEGTVETVALVEKTVASGIGSGRLVAVGECGLDYHYDHSAREAQRQVFAEQVAVAHRFELALVIHARDAWDDIFDVLRAERIPDRTVLHCFTGGPAEARRCLDHGMYISFSGILTFKNAAEVREAARLCPLDRLLVETDSPFLAPVPHRGKANEPAYVPLVGAAVAEVKGITADEVARTSAAAARAVFGLELHRPSHGP